MTPPDPAAALLRHVRQTPGDDTNRLVYADWLDENGDADYAEFIRTQVALARIPGYLWVEGHLTEWDAPTGRGEILVPDGVSIQIAPAFGIRHQNRDDSWFESSGHVARFVDAAFRPHAVRVRERVIACVNLLAGVPDYILTGPWTAAEVLAVAVLRCGRSDASLVARLLDEAQAEFAAAQGGEPFVARAALIAPLERLVERMERQTTLHGSGVMPFTRVEQDALTALLVRAGARFPTSYPSPPDIDHGRRHG